MTDRRTDRRTDVDRDAALAAGIALFNEGHVLAAHDPWEAAWLPLESGTDERLFHGLIAAAAATHHATERNWSGAVGCAENAVRYLDALGDDGETNLGDDADPDLRDADPARGVGVRSVRDWCRRLAADPEVIERMSPPALRVDGTTLALADLDLAATLLAAPALAGAIDAGTESIVEEAARIAREERGTGRTTVTELVVAFCRDPSSRPQVVARLADHVGRERRKRRDVDGLF